MKRHHPDEEVFTDFCGRERMFTYEVYTTSLGSTVTAKEKGSGQYEFSAFTPSDPRLVLGELRRKIRQRLATRYLHEDQGRIDFTHDRAVAQVTAGGVVIDGKFIPFDDFCRMLQAYEGSLLDLTIRDACSE